ncbi:MFS transporter, partial [Bosea sp. TAB14]
LPVVLVLVAIWGVSGWSYYPPQQARLIGVAGVANTPVILSLNASFMYLGFALGAGLGSVVISLSSVIWIGAAGGACVVAAMVLSGVAWRQQSRAS